MALILHCFSKVSLAFHGAGLQKSQIQHSILSYRLRKEQRICWPYQPATKDNFLPFFLKSGFTHFTLYNIKWTNESNWNIVQELHKNITFSTKTCQKQNIQNPQKNMKNMNYVKFHAWKFSKESFRMKSQSFSK